MSAGKAKGTFVGESKITQLLPADAERSYVLLQKVGNVASFVYVGAMDGRGIEMNSDGDVIQLLGSFASGEITAAGAGAVIRYQEAVVDIVAVAAAIGNFHIESSEIVVGNESKIGEDWGQVGSATADSESYKDELVGGYLKNAPSGVGASKFCDVYLETAPDNRVFISKVTKVAALAEA